MLRLILGASAFLSLIFFTPVVALFSALVLVLLYRAWEVLLIGLIADFLWMPATGTWHFVPFCTLLGILMVWLAEPLRSAFLNS